MPRYSVGHRFPDQTVHVALDRVQRYLAAVDSESPFYHQDNDVAPPLAIAAWVLAGLIEAIGLPPGSVHATQEFTFMDAAPLGSTLDAEAEVVQATSRAGMDVIVVEIKAVHEGRPVLSGRSMLLMPADEEEE
ncbi:MAG: MaoC family dehydratase [Chloroflexota bacterium]|nr:MaoC family dehydratase [Chloroflexota bacterium]MDE2930422.1 MaoC family dehydratase [Chloroflexota bacterium]